MGLPSGNRMTSEFDRRKRLSEYCQVINGKICLSATDEFSSVDNWVKNLVKY
jgi:hypothetical protein